MKYRTLGRTGVQVSPRGSAGHGAHAPPPSRGPAPSHLAAGGGTDRQHRGRPWPAVGPARKRAPYIHACDCRPEYDIYGMCDNMVGMAFGAGGNS